MGKLTSEDREQVVELLRCAADLNETRKLFFPLDDAALMVYGEVEHGVRGLHKAFEVACDAVSAMEVPCSTWQMLEAAQRVEEGSWP